MHLFIYRYMYVCTYIYIYMYICVCVYTCLYVLLSFLTFACLLLAQIPLTQQTCIVTCKKKMPRSTVRGPHPRPQQFLRIRYRFVNEAGYWFNIDNRNDFEPQFCPGGLQFGGVILRDLDGHTWAWYANDIDEPQFSDRWIWFPQGLYAAYFWPDGIPAGIPLPA